MKKNFLSLVVTFIALFLFPTKSFAFQPITTNSSIGCFTHPEGSSYSDVLSFGCLAIVIANVIELALMFVGVVTLLFLFYGAVRFIISRGDPKAIEGAQKTMTYAVLGLVIVLGSFILINVIFTALGYPNPLTQFSLFLSGYKVATFTP